MQGRRTIVDYVWPRVRPWLSGYRARTRNARLRIQRVERRSPILNAFHCCVQKTGSQWIRGILSDPRVYAGGGLYPYSYKTRRGFDDRNYREKTFFEAFPPHTIATPFFVSHYTIRDMPKRQPFSYFFVARDPRDIVISSFFSTKYSHGVNPQIALARSELTILEDEEAGMIATAARLGASGLFWAMETWLAADDPQALIVRYEDLIDPEQGEILMERVLRHCGIDLSSTVLTQVIADHSFARRSGRPVGQTDDRSHYRRGVAGDWRNYMTPAIHRAIMNVAGDVVEAYGDPS
jgi:hypothetical protein